MFCIERMMTGAGGREQEEAPATRAVGTGTGGSDYLLMFMLLTIAIPGTTSLLRSTRATSFGRRRSGGRRRRGEETESERGADPPTTRVLRNLAATRSRGHRVTAPFYKQNVCSFASASRRDNLDSSLLYRFFVITNYLMTVV